MSFLCRGKQIFAARLSKKSEVLEEWHLELICLGLKEKWVSDVQIKQVKNGHYVWLG